ncbi:3'(2'),5'-bisphosphate nucleotidase CysQ [Mesorhizobium sp. AaZ16]|uniref:3'(2'),5'-bisphosphate nucleotidase CysQ n=1 Tax=Mesorhizobium sp. AaZ16 TaxID=3402289 RepID=UPI00374F436F
MQAADRVDAAEMISDLPLLREAAREAGKIALRYFRQSPEVWMKTGQSPVSEADFAVDRYLRETLLAARPNYGWLSEETLDSAERLGSRRLFVVDPIDGTRGFLDGRTAWCVSIAVVEEGAPIAGVLECPAREETFWAVPGMGAQKNGIPLKVRDIGDAPEIAGPKQMINAMPQNWRERCRPISYIPSLAYRIAMIADGKLDATFVKPNAQDWDLAAADLILREAGGKVLTYKAKPPVYGGAVTTHGKLVAGSGRLLDVMGRVIADEA